MATSAPVEKRDVDRLCPRGVVSLSIDQGEGMPPAYAIVSDISEHGACVNSDRTLSRGQNIRLRIQFEAEPELFETGGRVAWTRPSVGDEKLYGGALTGIAFELPSESSGLWLRRILVSPDFEVPGSGSRHFDDLLDSLRPFLERLSDFVAKRSSRWTRFF